MKLVWSPETASKAYIDTVKACQLFRESGVAELVSAMAAGWNAKLIVETWSRGGVIMTSVGLAVASSHTGGRHVCVVPDEDSRAAYVAAMDRAGMSAEVAVGSPEEVMEGLEGIDFLVVDSRRNDFARMLRAAKLGHRGAVLVCKNASSRTASDFRWCTVVDGGSRRLVRSVFLPVGKGWTSPTWRPVAVPVRARTGGLGTWIARPVRSMLSGSEGIKMPSGLIVDRYEQPRSRL